MLFKHGLAEQGMELCVPEPRALVESKEDRTPVRQMQKKVWSLGLGPPLNFVNGVNPHRALVASSPRPPSYVDSIFIERGLSEPERAIGKGAPVRMDRVGGSQGEMPICSVANG